jgi:hypothetical protein
MFKSKWNYWNLGSSLVNLSMYLFVGHHWFNLATAIFCGGMIPLMEKLENKIEYHKGMAEHYEAQGKMFKEARERSEQGLPMTDEFIFHQLETLAENYSRGTIDYVTYLSNVEDAMEGKLVSYGIAIYDPVESGGEL